MFARNVQTFCSSLQPLLERIPVSPARRLPVLVCAIGTICAVGVELIARISGTSIFFGTNGKRRRFAPALPADVRGILDQSKISLANMLPADVKKNLAAVLIHGEKIMNPADKLAVFKMTERVAEDHISRNEIVEATRVRMETARKIRPDEQYDEMVAKLATPNRAVPIQPVGAGTLIKHAFTAQNLRFRDRNEVHVHAKLLPNARKKLERTLPLLIKGSEALTAELKDLCAGIKYKREQSSYVTRWDTKTETFTDYYDDKAVCTVEGWNNAKRQDHVLELVGVGQIRIGCEEKCNGEYNHLSIRFNPGISPEQAKEKLHMISSLLGIGEISTSTPPEEEHRLKLMHLFSVLCPQDASELEKQSPEIVAGPLDALEKEIIRKANLSQVHGEKVDMEKMIAELLPKMVQKEAYPQGPKVWCVPGIGEICKKAGLWGLMAGFEAFGPDKKPSFPLVVSRLMSVLEHGMLATQVRLTRGINAVGASSIRDLEGGGANYVFTRLFTKGMDDNPITYSYNNGIHLLFNPDKLETGGYGSEYDNNGDKDPDNWVYKTRSSALGLTKKLVKNHPLANLTNEWGTWEGVMPDRILVREEAQKQLIIQAMTQRNFIKGGKFNGKPIDEFIVVGDRFKRELWPE